MSESERVLPLSDPAKVEGIEPQRDDAAQLMIAEHVDTWDDYFLTLAKAASIKSKDPKCAVGAVIVSKENLVLSTGFNRLPRGVYDDEQTLLNVDEKLRMICHAEHNAILNAVHIGVRLKGATIYVTKFPCLACCIAIIQAGIKRIYTHDSAFWDDDPADKDHTRKKRLLHEAHMQVDAPFHPTFKPAEQIVVPKKKPRGTSLAPKKPS